MRFFLVLCVFLCLTGCAVPSFDSPDYQSWRNQQDVNMSDWWQCNQ